MGFSSGTTRTGAGPLVATAAVDGQGALGSIVAVPPAVVAAEAVADGPVPDRVVTAEPSRCATTTELLDRFCAAFGRGDVDGIADCYTSPAIVVTDERSVVFGSRGEVVDGFTAVLARYWSTGVVPSAGYTVRQETVLTATLREVTVEWCHRDAAGRERYRDHYRYLLRRENDGALRIHVAIIIDGGTDPAIPAVGAG